MTQASRKAATPPEVSIEQTGLNTGWDKLDVPVQAFVDGAQSYELDKIDKYDVASPVSIDQKPPLNPANEIESLQAQLKEQETKKSLDERLLNKIVGDPSLLQLNEKGLATPESIEKMRLSGKNSLLREAYLDKARLETKSSSISADKYQEKMSRSDSNIKFLLERTNKIQTFLAIYTKNINALEKRISVLKTGVIEQRERADKLEATGLRVSEITRGRLKDVAFMPDGKQFGTMTPAEHREELAVRKLTPFQDTAEKLSQKMEGLARTINTMTHASEKADQKFQLARKNFLNADRDLKLAEGNYDFNTSDKGARQELYKAIAARQKMQSALQAAQKALLTAQSTLDGYSLSTPDGVQKELQKTVTTLDKANRLLAEVGDPVEIDKIQQEANSRRADAIAGKQVPDENLHLKDQSHTLLGQALFTLDSLEREDLRQIKSGRAPNEENIKAEVRLRKTITHLKREALALKGVKTNLETNKETLRARYLVTVEAEQVYRKAHQGASSPLRADVFSSDRLAVAGAAVAVASMAPPPRVEVSNLSKYERVTAQFELAAENYRIVYTRFIRNDKKLPVTVEQVIDANQGIEQAREDLVVSYSLLSREDKSELSNRHLMTPDGCFASVQDPSTSAALKMAQEIVNKYEKTPEKDLPPRVMLAKALLGNLKATVDGYHRLIEKEYRPAQYAFLKLAEKRVVEHKPRGDDEIKIKADLKRAEKLVESYYDNLDESSKRGLIKPSDLAAEVTANTYYQRAIAQSKQGNDKKQKS